MTEKKIYSADIMEKLVSLAKRRGFIYQGSEIYGGLAGTYDYGPFGVALKNNIKNLWWKMFVDSRDYIYCMDAAILMERFEQNRHGIVFGILLALYKSLMDLSQLSKRRASPLDVVP